jgi:hypothetical protein
MLLEPYTTSWIRAEKDGKDNWVEYVLSGVLSESCRNRLMSAMEYTEIEAVATSMIFRINTAELNLRKHARGRTGGLENPFAGRIVGIICSSTTSPSLLLTRAEHAVSGKQPGRQTGLGR